MKHVHVACAIIEKDGLVLAAQRSESMSLPLKWEFPGGKLDPHESPAGCLKREIEEELRVEIRVLKSLPPSDWQYPDFAITLHPFTCSIDAGEIRLSEHKQVLWLPPGELPELDWAAADVPVLKNYLRHVEREENAA